MNTIVPAERFEVQPAVSNHFAWLRTRLAVARTFIAWLRTSVSLIGFGFTIVQFFQRLQGMQAVNGRHMAPEMPRILGLALIAAGLGALLVAYAQYYLEVKYLWGDPYKSIAGFALKPHRTPAFAATIVLALIGIAAFVSVFFRFF